MLAVKFKKGMDEVTESTTIKAMAGGKSAIQNEVVGELQAEFGSGPEGGAEMPLSELAGKFPGYTALGKVLNGHVNKMLQGKMPGGFSASQAKAYLGEERLVGPVRENASFCASLDFQ
jgi:fatty acid synthase subunit beta